MLAHNAHMETPDYTRTSAFLVVINTSFLVVEGAVVAKHIRCFEQHILDILVPWCGAVVSTNFVELSILVFHGGYNEQSFAKRPKS